MPPDESSKNKLDEALTKDELEALRKLSSPAIANAIETFGIRRRNEGYMDSSIKCIFPEKGAMVGYAYTAQISAQNPPTAEEEENRYKYLEGFKEAKAPHIVVMEDIDDPAITGTFWGEVNSSLHKALDCIGTNTNGAVRDLDEVREMGYQLFASGIIVSHAYVHITSFSKPVRVGGLVVYPGDLLHADKNGVVQIPSQIAKQVADAAISYYSKENKLISFAESKNFNLPEYLELFREFRSSSKKPASK